MNTRYTEVGGDAVDRIAQAHDSSRRELVELNPWLRDRENFLIHPGEEIIVPGAPPQNDAIEPNSPVIAPGAAAAATAPSWTVPVPTPATRRNTDGPSATEGPDGRGRGAQPAAAPEGTRWVNMGGRTLWANARNERVGLDDIYALEQNRGLEQNVGRMQLDEWVLFPDADDLDRGDLNAGGKQRTPEDRALPRRAEGLRRGHVPAERPPIACTHIAYAHAERRRTAASRQCSTGGERGRPEEAAAVHGYHSPS